jgi:hypothetical protein
MDSEDYGTVHEHAADDSFKIREHHHSKYPEHSKYLLLQHLHVRLNALDPFLVVVISGHERRNAHLQVG